MAVPQMNPAQQVAVEHQNGPMLVLAGAGSGKTRVITHRIARLLERGVPAHMICALTFTNKAAGEMAERVHHIVKEQRLGGKDGAKGIVISTFHSFGLMVLGRERKSLGGTFTIFDQGDCVGAVKDILSRIHANKAVDSAAVLARISNAKNAFLSPDELEVREGDEYDEITKVVYPKYQSALRSFRAFDFDDLVVEVARLWKERADILDRWQKEYLYVLVDEYQDTNRAQLEVLRLLCERHKNICVVGDDDQSIYAWRGADVRNILDFEEQFAGAKVVKLEQNYRSTAPILAVANSVIEKRSDSKYKKRLFTEKLGGDKVKLGVAPSPEAEAAYVARELRRIIREEQRKPKDCAILYRSNGQAKLLEEQLREQGVPYRMIGGQQFFERKEVKDVLAYLKLALNRADEISLRRVINYPPRGIGDTSVEKLTQHATAKGWSLWQAVERVDGLDGVSNPARDGCKQLEGIVGDLRKKLLIERAPASGVARELCEAIGLKKDIDATSTSTNAGARRWGNVEGLFGILGRREQRVEAKGGDATAERDLMAFLHSLTLQMSDEDEDPGNVVTLSTLHGSKGLEFDVVYLIGCEEGLIPHMRTLETRATDTSGVPGAAAGNSQDIEEERRLFYVGVTRARQRLELLRCKHRVMRGKPMPRTPCRFLMDIDDELLEHFEVKDASPMSVSEMATSANNLLAMLDALGK
ncbi:MAG: UvrD-helicase domain-containing protein [Labilithrix sp.]|nr:UvrD-helicase domain-containing protein [Labilithrix sp.]MBX3219489.1 UvrD-helicase domain-containing protein [Labilithrix sp.]